MLRSEFQIPAKTVFIEAVCVEDGKTCYPDDHIQRILYSLTAAGLESSLAKKTAEIYFAQALTSIPDSSCGTWKLRFTYSADTFMQTEAVPYKPKKITAFVQRELPSDIPLNSLYPLKFADRHYINQCLIGLEATEEVIMLYNDYITDAGSAALAFKRDGRWYTPNTPLLYSTARSREIRSGRLEPIEIRTSDLASFEAICLVNAMLPLGTRCFPISIVHDLQKTQERT